ncbi:lactate dehydrogenase subunit LctC [Acetobacterium tundrae]|uniref:Electron transfer flavoprotein subunit alpha n=1 Tax=Acetobacterium tundrae TaxID=132932 RepID=A0ABR6WM22_9FIRM|nr:lactate dehydrogenase subunit LctC [Acetobacterium tundrae]MBC3797565.1 electron transfer flavoprotein subunit alpha [Acetobacterium tundrae]
MAGIKIIKENAGREIYEALTEICPFGAFSYENDKLEVTAACKMCKMCLKKGPEGILILEEDEKVAIDKDLYRGITVYVDHIEGKVHPVTLELIGKARELAKVTNHPVYALLMGTNIKKPAEELLNYGVDKVFVYDEPELKHFVIEPYANAFEDFIEKIKPSSILVGATNVGRSLAPRVAARYRTGLTADCTILEMKENTDLVQIRPAFGGNIMAQIVTENNRPQFCTVRYKVFNAPEFVKDPWGTIEIMEIEKEKLISSIEVLEVIKKEKGLDISEADTIVAVGRGVKSEKDLDMINEFAEKIGAVVACTRPGIEAGWFDAKLQIGLSGRTVKPKLIIALGISGAVQFAAGMQNSEYIIAINNDPKAPIFNVAHCGMVGDLYEILPELLKMIEASETIKEQEITEPEERMAV